MFSELGKAQTVNLRMEGDDSHKGYIQVDERDGTILYVTVWNEAEAGTNYRRKGYGTQLVELAENHLRDKGFKVVRLQALREARPFWKALGYTSVTGDENYSKKL